MATTARTIEIKGRDLKVGDLMAYSRRTYRVQTLAPYVGSLVDDGTLPPETMTAHCEAGFRITVIPNCEVTICVG